MEERTRKVAAHEVRVGEKVLQQAVVELQAGKVVGYYSFVHEQAMTEWLGGTIEIIGDRAYWDGKLLE